MLPFTQVCGRECVKSAFLHIAVEPLLVNTPNCEGMRRMAARQALQKVSDPLTMSVFRGKGGGEGLSSSTSGGYSQSSKPEDAHRRHFQAPLHIKTLQYEYGNDRKSEITSHVERHANPVQNGHGLR